MWISVPIKCPICHHDNDESPDVPQAIFKVALDMIEEVEGDSTIPYGLNRFTTYNDYKLPTIKSDHYYCTLSLERPQQLQMLTKLLEAAFELALPIYDERRTDARINNTDECI